MTNADKPMKTDQATNIDDFESLLTSHYEKHKKGVKAPPCVKKQVMQKAHLMDRDKNIITTQHWFSQLTLAASVLLLLVFLILPDNSSIGHFKGDPNIVNQTYIELHTLDTPKQSHSKALAYASLEQEYARKNLLASVIQKQARLEINDDGSWLLDTCDDNGIQISRELVAMLDKYQVISSPVNTGVIVSVSFDNRGHITKIIKDEVTAGREAKMC